MTRLSMIAVAWVLAMNKGLNRLDGLESHYNTIFDPIVTGSVISSFFLIFALVSFKRTGWFADRNWILLGSLTYPLYLVHQNVGFMIFNIAYPYINPTLVFISTLLFVMLTSYFVHKYIELKISVSLRNVITNFLNIIISIKKRYTGLAEARR